MKSECSLADAKRSIFFTMIMRFLYKFVIFDDGEIGISQNCDVI